MNTDIDATFGTDEDTSTVCYEMPCAEAVLAATLALTSALAQGSCEPHRSDMVARIVAHLQQLTHNPMLSEGFKAMLWNLRSTWQLAQDNERAVARSLSLCHAQANTVH
jgi:hypothetical protein